MISKTKLLVFAVLLALSNHNLIAQAIEEEECYVSAEGETICHKKEVATEAEEQPPVHRHEEEPPQEQESVVVDEVEQEIQQEEEEEQPVDAESHTPDQQQQEQPAEEVTEEEPPVQQQQEEEIQQEPEQEIQQEQEATADEPTQTQQQTEAEENDPHCPSRRHVIQCASKYLDKNQNNYLERSELQGAIDQLPWLSRGILKILGSVDKMMVKCDVDKDDAIGIEYDMTHNSETCLATCFKRRAFKSAFFPDCDL